VSANEINNEELLNMAIRAAKNGQKDNARVMFRQVYDRNKRNETAMLWLAKVAKDEKERVQWLKRLLEANPENKAAQKALRHMSYKKASADNRTLFVFGAVAAVMIVVVLVVLVIALS
jgi:hypothetical protein